MDEIDKLLAKIDKKQPIDRIPDRSPDLNLPTQPLVPPTVKQQKIDAKSIDDLLGSLGETNSQPLVNPPITNRTDRSPDKSLDSILSTVRSDLDAERTAQAAAELRQQQELEAERDREERAKQGRLDRLANQRRQELKREAEIWLRQLKPKSDEARWFEEFACNYDTPLEAAIEYLDALKTVDRTILNQ